MWFLFSLLTIFAWGGSDLFTKMGTNPRDRFSHLRVLVTVGAVMGLHAVAYIVFTGFDYNPKDIITYLPVSFMYILSMALGYVGLRYIELSISSPICNSSGAVAALLCFAFLGQRMTGLQFFAVAVICGGIFMLSVFQRQQNVLSAGYIDRRYTRSAIALVFPLLYCLIDGVGSFMDAYWLEHILEEEAANLSYEFTFLIVGLLALLYLIFVKRERPFVEGQKYFSAGAICETAGQFFYIFALGDNAIVAAPMIASYSIFSVLLSRLFLKEKLSAKQYAAIISVMVGIAILGIE